MRVGLEILIMFLQAVFLSFRWDFWSLEKQKWMDLSV